MKNQIKNKLIKQISNVAVKNSIDSVSSCCYFLCHQPNIPESVKQLKNEYNKLLKNKDLKGLNLEEKEVKNEEKEEDPLERTINFYMAKQG